MNDIPHMQQSFNPNGGPVQFGNDEKLIVWFHDKSVVDPIQSREAQRPIHVKQIYVHIQQAGERDYVDKPADREHQMRFPRQWAAYQQGTADIPPGTPLSILFPNNPEIIENLKYLKIQVVEQLAEINDTQIQNIGLGGREWHEAAKKYLAASEKGKGFSELEAKLNMALSAIEGLTEKNKALEAALDEANQERKPRGKAA